MSDNSNQATPVGELAMKGGNTALSNLLRDVV